MRVFSTSYFLSTVPSKGGMSMVAFNFLALLMEIFMRIIEFLSNLFGN